MISANITGSYKNDGLAIIAELGGNFTALSEKGDVVDIGTASANAGIEVRTGNRGITIKVNATQEALSTACGPADQAIRGEFTRTDNFSGVISRAQIKLGINSEGLVHVSGSAGQSVNVDLQSADVKKIVDTASRVFNELLEQRQAGQTEGIPEIALTDDELKALEAVHLELATQALATAKEELEITEAISAEDLLTIMRFPQSTSHTQQIEE